MIVLRRPWKIYDVDVLGLVLLGLMVGLVYLLVLVPMRANWTGFQRANLDHRSAEKLLAVTQTNRDQLVAQLERLRSVADRQVDRAPDQTDVTSTLTDLARLAEAQGLNLQQVEPSPISARSGHFLVDVKLTATGESREFIRFLDAFWRHNPYHSIPQFALRRAPKADTVELQLAWTVRLHLAPGVDEAADPEIGK